jgi:glutathione S-transferase
LNEIANKLVEDDTVITESTVINEYLDGAYLEPMAKSRRI